MYHKLAQRFPERIKSLSWDAEKTGQFPPLQCCLHMIVRCWVYEVYLGLSHTCTGYLPSPLGSCQGPANWHHLPWLSPTLQTWSHIDRWHHLTWLSRPYTHVSHIDHPHWTHRYTFWLANISKGTLDRDFSHLTPTHTCNDPITLAHWPLASKCFCDGLSDIWCINRSFNVVISFQPGSQAPSRSNCVSDLSI